MRFKFLLVLLGSVLWIVSCQNEDPTTQPSNIIITNNNVNNNGQGGDGTGASPPPGTIARVALGCFLMRGPANEVLPDCAAGGVTYTCDNAPCSGVMNATPLDAEGKQVPGASVAGWSVVGDCVVPDLTGSDSDAFTPPIVINAGSCIVSVSIAGAPIASRPFVGL